MKYFIIILFLLSNSAFATNYYVDNSGDDSHAGTSEATAWQTIAKVNSFSFSSGDSILLKASGSWKEQLRISTNGVIVSSYGVGAKPIITALQTVTGFTNYSGNIWVADISYSVAKLNTVLIDGEIRAKGRYPNTGYLTVTSSSGKYQTVVPLGGVDYTGAELASRNTHWIIDVVKITSQSGDTLNYTDSTTYIPIFNGGNGCFIQNSLNVLDTLNEWYFDSTNKRFYVYATASPNVQISTIDTLIYSHKTNSVSINGIQVLGANKAAIYLDSCKYDTIRNCFINNSGAMAIAGVTSPHTTIQYDSILNSLSNAIFFRELTGYLGIVQSSDSSFFQNNYIKNTGSLAGMGLNGNGKYMGINVLGYKQIVTDNRIDSTGFNALVWYGKNSLIKNNYITNYCYVKDDGGGINTGMVPNMPVNYDSGAIVRGNITVNSPGAAKGTVSASQAPGIYFDYKAGTFGYVTTDSNTVINAYEESLYIGDYAVVNLFDNTLISLGKSNGLFTSNNGVAGTWHRNIYYVSDTTHLCLYDGAFTVDQKSDYNYYLRPKKPDGAVSGTTLAHWIDIFHVDSNSVLMPARVTTADPIVAYNPTHSDSTISLNGLYIDAKGHPHNNSATIPQFGSLLLFKADYEVFKNGFSIGNLKFSTQ